MTVHVEQAPTAPSGDGGAIAVARARACRPRVRHAHAGQERGRVHRPERDAARGDLRRRRRGVLDRDDVRQFLVYGLVFSTGDLYLKLGAYQLIVPVHADGSFDPATFSPSPIGTVTVTR